MNALLQGFPEGENLIFSDRFEHAVSAGHVLERLTYGATPDDIDEFNDLGSNDAQRLNAWVDLQLDWQALDDSAAQQRITDAGYQTLGKSIQELWADHYLGNPPWAERIRPVAEVEAARMIRAVYSHRQLYEMLVEFWHDHFNVAGWEFSIAPIFVQYDRDVIRPHALGNFRIMLEEMAKSTAMMFYLDNRRNRSGGYNENFARELMELHTLGVDVYYPGIDPSVVPSYPDGLKVGYCDHDVYDVARCFTGWTVRDGHWEFPGENDGAFAYRNSWHEQTNKYVLGRFIINSGQEDARTAMDLLASHPATARHLCAKLCRRFIDDDPPEALVESAADVWKNHVDAPDQIAHVVRHILASGELLAGGGIKIRRPWEMLIAALRKTGAEISPRHAHDPDVPWEPYRSLNSYLRQTGHGPFRWPSPDGYPDTARRWTSVSVMGQSWRMLSRLPQYQDQGEPLLPIQTLTEQALPGANERTAENIVNWWIERLIGHAPAPARRDELIEFMQQDADPDEPLNIETDQWGGENNLKGHYVQQRLRATISLIMMCPEFHQR